MGIDVREMAPEDPAAAALLRAQEAELDARYGGGDPNPPVAGAFAPPAGSFLVAFEDGVAVACGGVRRFDAATAEIKRMYTVPAARGRGLGGRVLAALEDRARAAGYTRCRLETGVRQPEAIAVYERAGYAPIPCWPPYDADPLSVCLARDLQA